MSALFDQIKSALDRFSAAWESNDGAAVARFFVEDGALMSPFGERADGRAAIASMYSEYFAGLLRGTWTTFHLTRVRAVADNHVFADGEQTIYASDGNVVLAVHLAALLRRDDDDWRFADARPFIVAAIPD